MFQFRKAPNLKGRHHIGLLFFLPILLAAVSVIPAHACNSLGDCLVNGPSGASGTRGHWRVVIATVRMGSAKEKLELCLSDNSEISFEFEATPETALVDGILRHAKLEACTFSWRIINEGLMRFSQYGEAATKAFDVYPVLRRDEIGFRKVSCTEELKQRRMPDDAAELELALQFGQESSLFCLKWKGE